MTGAQTRHKVILDRAFWWAFAVGMIFGIVVGGSRFRTWEHPYGYWAALTIGCAFSFGFVVQHFASFVISSEAQSGIRQNSFEYEEQKKYDDSRTDEFYSHSNTHGSAGDSGADGH